MELGERIRHVRDRLVKPSDQQIVQRFLDRDIRTVASVPCSITATLEAQWQDMAASGQMRLIRAVNEHALVGIASGVYLGSGETTLVHMQNSGFTNSADGLVSFAEVYGIPVLELVTWRGNNEKDDSEPHQAIGRRTNSITREIAGARNVFGDRLGRGILRAIDKAVDHTRSGGISIIRLSPDAFKKTYPLSPPKIEDEPVEVYEERYERIKAEKGTPRRVVLQRARISRSEAMREIDKTHPNAAIIFSNGYNARAGQAEVDKIGNLYNAGYMGGAAAIAFGMAKSNPGIEVVWVDGDQNAEMGCVKDNLAGDYPPNLQGYILDNGIGASVGTARSVPLAPWYYDLAHVIRTTPDGLPGEFKYQRVGAHGRYFEEEEVKHLAKEIGALPAHTIRFRHWVEQQTRINQSEAEKFAQNVNDIVRNAPQFPSL